MEEALNLNNSRTTGLEAACSQLAGEQEMELRDVSCPDGGDGPSEKLHP